MRYIQVIDSHTAGEPTRVVISGGPDLGTGSMAERLEVFRSQYDHFRSAIVNEPRGSDIVVGAILCTPYDESSAAGVIFFNNVGYLGMCGHGTIGVVATLYYQGKLLPGEHRIETPVGVVTATLHEDGRVSVVNIPAYRIATNVAVEVPEYGRVQGDVAWGGNWFYLVQDHGLKLSLANVSQLTDATSKIRLAINAAGYPDVDHVELFGPAESPAAHSRNFVLCPGNAYDRSPCGTGTSAKLACLAADGKLQAGESWVQESIIGTHFHGTFEWEDRSQGRIVPTVMGSAYISAESRLILNADDPFQWGIRSCQ